MGGGTYSSVSKSLRDVKDYGSAAAYASAGIDEVFKQKEINNAMNPYGIKVRESRDSDEHPNSLAIVLGLDVTGSMGSVPHYLVKEGLPAIMETIIKTGILDPQVLFLGIGDHECDRSPLQVGQFESSDELLDKWLTDIYLEGGGGGNEGESYSLAWYLAANHTAIDCFEKRKEKGFLFTIGDEPFLKDIPGLKLKNLMGSDEVYKGTDAMSLYEKAKEKYNVFHIHIGSTNAGGRQETKDMWKQLLGDNLLIAKKKEDVSKLISETILKYSNIDPKIVKEVKEEIKEEKKTEDML